jgi:hypothetical protein
MKARLYLKNTQHKKRWDGTGGRAPSWQAGGPELKPIFHKKKKKKKKS